MKTYKVKTFEGIIGVVAKVGGVIYPYHEVKQPMVKNALLIPVYVDSTSACNDLIFQLGSSSAIQRQWSIKVNAEVFHFDFHINFHW